MFIIIIAFFIILGLLVLAHELGHFFTARIFGVRAEEFGFGLPPRLFGFYRNAASRLKFIWGKKFNAADAPKTLFSLNAIPIGGFVKIKGENGEEQNEPDSFGHKKIWQRVIILSSGVLMNVLVCILLLTIGFNFGIPAIIDDETISQVKSVRDEKIQIVSVNVDSPAAAAGILVGDNILALDNISMTSAEAIQNYTKQHPNQKIIVTLERGQNKLSLNAIPQILPTSEGQAVLGVGLVQTGIVSYPWYASLWQALKATYFLILAMFGALYDLLKNIIAHGEVTAELAGPVGIAVLTGQMVRLGLAYLLQFAALLSLNLALINILPFPALDGGRILFLIIEKIRGRALDQKLEALIHNIGFAVLMLLILLVTYRDLVRWGGKIIEKIT